MHSPTSKLRATLAMRGFAGPLTCWPWARALGDAGRAILVEDQVYYDPEVFEQAFDAPPRTSGSSRRGPSSGPVMGMPVPSAFAYPYPCLRYAGREARRGGEAERRGGGTEQGVWGVAGCGSHHSAVLGDTQGVRVVTDTA